MQSKLSDGQQVQRTQQHPTFLFTTVFMLHKLTGAYGAYGAYGGSYSPVLVPSTTMLIQCNYAENKALDA